MVLDLENKIYTSDEVAELLRISSRAIIKLAKAGGCCSRVGRDYLFSREDINALWEAVREPAKAPKSKVSDVPLSNKQLRESLLHLTGKKRKRKTPHV